MARSHRHQLVTREPVIMLGLLLWLAGTSAAQTGPGAPQRRWDHEFVRVAAACERADGSLLASDPGDNALVLLSPDGTVAQLGRRGFGPGEYESPGACFPLPGDTVLVFDRAVRRFIVVPPRDPKTASLGWPRELGPGWLEPRGVDERGAMVLEARPEGSQAALIRWQRAAGTVDTLTRVEAGASRTRSAGAAMLRRDLPLSPRDGVVAAPGLGMAVVRPNPFQVDVWRGGARRQGGPIPFQPVAVDQADVDAYVAAQSPPPGTMGMRSDGQRVALGDLKLTLEQLGLTREDFPKTKPAFDPDGLFVAPDGAVWIRLHRPSRERAERYEVWTPA